MADASSIIQSVITLVAIAAGVLGMIGGKGNRRAAKILRVIIEAIEETQNAGEVKESIRTHTARQGLDTHLNDEIERVTGKAVRARRPKVFKEYENEAKKG